MIEEIKSECIFWVMASFGENVKRLRKTAGLKGKDLAVQVGVKPSVISGWENNRSGLPETPTLFKLAKALKCPIDELLDGVDEQYDTLMRHLVEGGLRYQLRWNKRERELLDRLLTRYKVVLLSRSRSSSHYEQPAASFIEDEIAKLSEEEIEFAKRFGEASDHDKLVVRAALGLEHPFLKQLKKEAT